MPQKKSSWAIMGLCVLLIAIEAAFTFCGRKKCVGFVHPTFDEWFPYDTSYKRLFISSTNVDSLKINYLDKTQPYETSGGFESKGCRATATISGYTKSNLAFGVYADETNSFTISLQLGGLYADGNQLNDSGLINTNDYKKFTSTYAASASIGNKTFSKVQSITVDTVNNKPFVYKIWLSKGVGIVAYQKRSNNELFVLQ